MSWLPKRDELDSVQASAVDFAVAQEGELLHQGRGRDGGKAKLLVVFLRYGLAVERF